VVTLLNHFDWIKVDEKSDQFNRAFDYATKKFRNSLPIFINSKISPYGRHFELSFLNENK